MVTTTTERTRSGELMKKHAIVSCTSRKLKDQIRNDENGLNESLTKYLSEMLGVDVEIVDVEAVVLEDWQLTDDEVKDVTENLRRFEEATPNSVVIVTDKPFPPHVHLAISFSQKGVFVPMYNSEKEFVRWARYM